MDIFVKDIAGISHKIEVDPSDTIAMVRAKLENEKDVYPMFLPETKNRFFLFNGQQLEEDKTLTEYNIEHESTIHEEMRLCGGPCTNCNKCPCECKKGGYELCSQVVQIMYKFWDM